jgi:hypothetical protein
MPATPELDEAERAALAAELRQVIAADPFPLSPRIRKLRTILAKLGSARCATAAIPGAEAGRRAEPCAAQEATALIG